MCNCVNQHFEWLLKPQSTTIMMHSITAREVEHQSISPITNWNHKFNPLEIWFWRLLYLFKMLYLNWSILVIWVTSIINRRYIKFSFKSSKSWSANLSPWFFHFEHKHFFPLRRFQKKTSVETSNFSNVIWEPRAEMDAETEKGLLSIKGDPLSQCTTY